MTKIHVISELYYPEQNATGYFLTGIAEALADGDAPVSVLCAQPSYNQRGTRAAKVDVREGVSIRRCWSTTFDPKKTLGRLINFVTTSVSISLRAVGAIRKNDKVLVVTNPPLLPFLIRAICRLKGARFVLLVHDVYPDVFVPLGLLKPEHPLYRFLSWLNGRLYASADSVIVLGRDMANLVRAKSKGDASISIIPNWGDVGSIIPIPKEANQLLKDLGISDQFIVHYSGNHGRTHDLLSVIEAANVLRNDSDVHFLFIGEGSGKAQAVARAEALGLKNVTFRSFVDRSELNTSLNASDLSVVAFKKGMAGISVPSRLYNLMAAGKPILAIVDDDSEVAAVVREEEIGRIVAPQKPEAIVQAILQFKNDATGRSAMGLKARAVAEEKYSYSAVKAQYQSLFKSL